MKVLVFGTGGVGGIYAYFLHQGGAQVTVVCRSNYDAVFADGIEIDSAMFGRVHFRPSHVVRTVEEACRPPREPLAPAPAAREEAVNGHSEERESRRMHYDYVLVTAKALPGTAARIAAAVASDATAGSTTAIVLAQNGIDVEQEYKKLYPRSIIISGVVYLPTTQVAPGKIRMGNLQHFHIGLFTAPTAEEAVSSTTSASQEKTAGDAAVEAFAHTFSDGGGVIHVHNDIQPQRWIKLAVNVAWNPVCALTRLDDANFLRSSPQAEASVRALMTEVAAIASARGFPELLTAEVIDAQISRPRARLETGGKEPSMLTDVREGRGMEVEAIVGNAVRAAQAMNVSTPRLELLYALIRGLDYAIQPDERWRPIA